MTDNNTIHTIAREFGKAFMPLQAAMESPEAFSGFMRELGWSVEDIPDPIRDLLTALELLRNAYIPILEGDADPADFVTLIDAIRNLIQQVDALKDADFDPALALADFANTFPKQVIQYLLVEYLMLEQPKVAFLLSALGIIKFSYIEAVSEGHFDYVKREILWVDLSRLLQDPVQIFENLFGWRTEDFAAELVFRLLADFLISIGLTVALEELEEAVAHKLENNVEIPGDPTRLGLNIILFEKAIPEEAVLRGGLKLLGLPKDDPFLPGLALLPYLTGKIDKDFEISNQLALTVESTLDIEGGIGIKLRPFTGIEIIRELNDPDTSSMTQGSILISLVNRDRSGDPIILIGSDDGSRLEYKAISLKCGLFLDAKDETDLFVELSLEEARLVIKAGKADSFLQKILPGDGIESEFDVAIGLSQLQGFYFRGSGGLEVELPTHLAIGPIELQSITIAAGLSPFDSAIAVFLGATVKAELGPLTAQVENMGLKANFTFPEDNSGVLGPLDIDIDFKPPNGVGLSIDGGGFKGGGFLRFDQGNERYTGVMELEYQDRIELKAIGLLTTNLPGGQEGFSLLILITAEFQPIQLGFGFTLNGVGGLLGLNRTAKIERLRSGVKDNTLSSILFPTDIVANANRIISDLRQIFPPQENRFIFGPMAKIGWGSPTLITIDLGLMIEVPDPVRIAILGVVRATLPDEKAALLQLQVNFLGVIDFEKEQLSFDASLYDSKLLAFPLSGDMAIRLNWGNDPNFLLTVGGFHPAYEPPPMNLPVIRRLTLQLLKGNNPRLTLETYFAVTSNTAQFGAKLELYAGAGSFNVYGFLSFDALFQFNPFYFITQIGAMLALRKGSSSIASIKLDLTLEGTTPWKARGTARLKLFWFLTVKVRFSKTFGEERNITFPDIDVMPLLEAALSATGNWQSRIPARSHLLVSLKQLEATGDAIITHPFGILEVSQKVVPLNLRIDKFGNQKSSDGNKFQIQNVKVGAESQDTAATEEFFAPAQFFEKTDSEKLSSESFKKFDGGIRIISSEKLIADYYARRDVEYKLFYIDSQRDQLLALWPDFLAPDAVAFNSWAVNGAISNSDLSFSKNRKSALAPDEVTVGQENFAVVNNSDLTLLDNDSLVRSEVGALNKMQDLIQENPALEGNIQVVPQFEVNEL